MNKLVFTYPVAWPATEKLVLFLAMIVGITVALALASMRLGSVGMAAKQARMPERI